MAKNTGKGSRQGIIKGRTQTYNPKTKKFVLIDAKTKKFMKCQNTPFKQVRKDDAAKKEWVARQKLAKAKN